MHILKIDGLICFANISSGNDGFSGAVFGLNDFFPILFLIADCSLRIARKNYES